ncbi:MAG TPA: hypothetical protein PLS53_11765 [Thermoanaerobaculaceae bacterium]|nr:hypothetical protein [Thermoanaerobaculaceae bacterium]
MSDIEIHIKSGTFSYDAAFAMGDSAAAQEAQEWVTFILNRAAGATATTKPAPRKAKRAAATTPFGVTSATEEEL